MTYGHAPQTLYPDATDADDARYWQEVAAHRAAACATLADDLAAMLDKAASKWTADDAEPLKRAEDMLRAVAAIIKEIG